MSRWFLIFGWLCLSGLVSSCLDESGEKQDEGDTSVAFTFSGIGADVSEGAVSTRGDKLASGTTVRVVAYKGTTYMADHTYTADASGNLVADAGEMRLIEDTYDFYAVSPALAIATKGSSGPTFTVSQGVDFAAVKTSYKVTAYSGSGFSTKCTVPLGELVRKCAKLTFNIEPGSDVPLTPTSLKVTGVKLTAMPSSLTATGATLPAGSGTATVSIPASAFSSSGTKCTGSTVVLPKTSGTFSLSIDAQFNGSGVTVTFPTQSLAAMSFDAGKQHIFTLKLMKDRVGVWATTVSTWTDNNQAVELGGIYLNTDNATNPPTWKDSDQEQALGAGAINLSACGTANCYIVTKAGEYSFDATVMGNGKTTPAHTKGSVSGDIDSPAIVPATLAPAGVEVLWETLNTTKAPTAGDIVSDVKLDGGRVTFRSGSAQGNAVIAVKNAGGTILWSWHIWRVNAVDEFPLAAIGSVTTDGELVLMDRNLGALSATAQDDLSIGFHYQWGRKDPFPGCAGFVDPNKVVIATTPSGIPVIPGSSVTSIAQSVASPTTFFRYGGDWCSPRTDNLWGTPLTGTVTINNGEQDYTYNSNKGSKSIYDPCPPGWRVPPGYAFANPAKGSMTMDKGYSFPIGQSNSISWFPASGDRSSSSGALVNVGSGGNYWVSAPFVDTPAYGGILYFNSGGVNPAGGSVRANGNVCRCCKE